MTDEEQIESLGFVRAPKCPITVRNDAIPMLKHWSPGEIQRDEHLARLWKNALKRYEAQKVKLSVLNECLCVVIRERFYRRFGRTPACSLAPFLFAPEETTEQKKK